MLLRPSNTLLLDEPTNHLDLDSKDVLLEALADFGGTLIFVSHDRYFVDRLATKIIEVGGGDALVYPGTYEEFHWKKEHGDRALPTVAAPAASPAAGAAPRTERRRAAAPAAAPPPPDDRERKRQAEIDARRKRRAAEALQTRIADLESRVAEKEQAIKEIEAAMASPGFYDNLETAQPQIDRHQRLMWEVGDLMNQWEDLQSG
jgi:ATP-binding cassette subfamily F protein 3